MRQYHLERREAAIYVPAFALIEVSESSQCGHFTLPAPFETWATSLANSGAFIVHELTLDVVRRHGPTPPYVEHLVPHGEFP